VAPNSSIVCRPSARDRAVDIGGFPKSNICEVLPGSRIDGFERASRKGRYPLTIDDVQSLLQRKTPRRGLRPFHPPGTLSTITQNGSTTQSTRPSTLEAQGRIGQHWPSSWP
jgi:hypothetical protein